MTWMLESDDPLVTAADAIMRRLARGDSDEPAGRMVCEHLDTGGKRLRARLGLSATAALGGDPSGAVGWAAACELLHNATLVHDDIQDGDRMRRGQPTAWVRHGVAQAVNAGDLMFLAPFAALAEVGCDDGTRAQLCNRLSHRGCTVIRGQAAELELTASADASAEVYLRAIEGKTSALFELPVEGAAVIAGCAPAAIDAIAVPFRALGIIFQLQDDVLDLYGDKGREAAGADLREGKISALVVEHLALRPQDRSELRAMLEADRDETSAAEIGEMIDRFRESGALGAVVERIKSLTESGAAAPAFAQHTGLGELYAELNDLILRPIAHVL